MLIQVSQGDIDNGTPGMCGFCPVAVALLRQTGAVWLVYSDGQARPYIGDPAVRITLPPEVAEAVRRYDAGLGMEPFEFDLPWEGCA